MAPGEKEVVFLGNRKDETAVVPSLIQSVFCWRNALGESGFQEYKIPEGMCERCGGAGHMNEPDYGFIYCACSMARIRRDYQEERFSYSTTMYRKDLNQIVEWGTSAQMQDTNKLLDAVQEFVDGDPTWLTIMGPPGTGKTHSVQWLAQRMYPWAVYISGPELEKAVYDNLDEDSLGPFKNALKATPILIIDDLYANYNSKFGGAAVGEILDYRWNFGREKPTIVVTNFSQATLRSTDYRVADRVLDNNLVRIIEMKNSKSYRTAHE